ncbi:hypothetical protein [Gemmata sp.]|uniref:hypothetical protein n=1 Tax=Gemmata sp. TaxID=1914242 RepID=UPI003F7018B3
MKVVVQILPEARHELIRLLESRCRTKAAALDVGTVYLEDITQQFHQHQGIPTGVRRTRAADGNERWWRYADGIWVVYHMAEVRRLFGGTVRTITVVQFEPALPVL